MGGVNLGDIYAVLKLVNEFSPALDEAVADTSAFAKTVEEAAGPTQALSGAMTQVASTATEAAVQQAALGSTTKTTSLAATEAAVAQTAFTAAALKSTDAGTLTKAMMAEMTAAAEANAPATAAVATTHTELSAVLAVATAAWEAVAVPLGLVTIAVVALGPRLWELAGGWDGVKAAGAEAWQVLSDLGTILGSIGGYVLDAVIEGVKATADALANVGGIAVDAVVWFGDIFGVWSSIAAISSSVASGIHEVADAIRAVNAELPDSPTGFQAPTVSFGIDPNDTASVAAWIAETDKAIAASTAATQAQKEYNDQIARLVEQFSGAGALEKAQQYELVLGKIGGATHLTADEQAKYAAIFQAVIDKYELLGPKGAAVVAHFEALLAAVTPTLKPLTDLTDDLTTFANGSLYTGVSVDNMNASFTEAGQSIANVIPSTNLLTSSLMGLPVQPLNQNVSQVVATMQTWEQQIYSIANAFLVLGSVIPGVTGDIFNFIGSALNGFNTLIGAIKSIPSSISQISSGFSSLSSGGILSGITGIMSGIGGIAGAAGAAIQVVSALGSALKRAFTSEETEFVNPNRDLFIGQFEGQYGDAYVDWLEAMNKAIRIVYFGGDMTVPDSALVQYGQPLYDALQNADTYVKFRSAQLAIAELFRKAGVTIDIFNESGIGTQYQSSVFDTGYSGPPITSSTDLGALQTQYTTGASATVYGAYNTGTASGGSTFQSGQMIGTGGPCIHIDTANFYGASGKELAQSFFDYILSGAGIGAFRDAMCAAGTA